MTVPGIVVRFEPAGTPVLRGPATPVEYGPLSAVATGDVDLSGLLKRYDDGPAPRLLNEPGDYAVVVANTERGLLTGACKGLARLFYSRSLVTSSRADLDVPLAPDTDGVRRFVDTGEVRFLFDGVGQVLPGDELLLYSDGSMRDPRSDPSQVYGGGSQPATPAPEGTDPAPKPADSAPLEDVARLVDHLTAHLWQYLDEVGTPPATPAEYVAWAANRDQTWAASGGQPPPLVPTTDLLLRLKNRIYGSFLSDTFAARPWLDVNPAIAGFEEFIKGHGGDADRFWRLYLSEQWARVVFEAEPAPVETPPKGPFDPNRDKQLEITVEGEQWLRFPIRTELFAKGDDLEVSITGYVSGLVTAASEDGREIFTRPWYLVVSEKIVAIAQGRSYFIWEIKPNWWARTLSKYVVRTPYGIGLGSPWTMQLALQEVGLPRILFASAVSLAGKALGKRGWFYRVAGPAVRAIDGPTEYSAYPANVSAKLAPARPAAVSAELAKALRRDLSAPAKDTLRGVVVIDANDIGRNVMGQASDRPDGFFEAAFADNPLGQGDERTPLCVVVAGE